MSADFWTTYYGSFVGATIVSFDGMNTEDDLGDGFPTFTVKFKDGSVGTVEVSQDPEGNGGGFLFGLSTPNV